MCSLYEYDKLSLKRNYSSLPMHGDMLPLLMKPNDGPSLKFHLCTASWNWQSESLCAVPEKSAATSL